MTSSGGFWLPDGPSNTVLYHSEDMEAVLLNSLRANLFSRHGLNLYVRASREELSQRRGEGGVGGGGDGASGSPFGRSSQCLPEGHPVREGLEAMLESAGLPSRPPPPTSSLLSLTTAVPASESEATGEEVGLSASRTTTATEVEPEEMGAVENAADDKQFHTEAETEAEHPVPPPPPQNEQKKSAPTSALAKLVAMARAAVPPRQQNGHPAAGAEEDDDDEEEEDEEEEDQVVAQRTRRERRREPARLAAPLSSSLLLPPSASSSSSPLTAVGRKRARESPSASQGGEDERVEDGDVRHPTTAGSEERGEAAPSLETKHPSQMTREEFLSQFKRAPRRGEIGQSAEEIEKAEALGYVMSGSRSKASHLFINRVQRQLHERDAAKWEQQFRQVEDERMNARLIDELAQFVKVKLKHGTSSSSSDNT